MIGISLHFILYLQGISGKPVNIMRYMRNVLYSLKFSRLKIFADFVGQSKATKIFSYEIFFCSSLMLGVAGS